MEMSNNLVHQFSLSKLTLDSETMSNNALDPGARHQKVTNNIATWSDVKDIEKLSTGRYSCISIATLDVPKARVREERGSNI